MSPIEQETLTKELGELIRRELSPKHARYLVVVATSDPAVGAQITVASDISKASSIGILDALIARLEQDEPEPAPVAAPEPPPTPEAAQ
jgi:hypothetical protein